MSDGFYHFKHQASDLDRVTLSSDPEYLGTMLRYLLGCACPGATTRPRLRKMAPHGLRAARLLARAAERLESVCHSWHGPYTHTWSHPPTAPFTTIWKSAR